MKQWFNQLIKAPWIILLSWLVFIMFIVIVLPAVAMTSYERGLLESIDTNFSFDSSRIYPIVASYGEAGRAYYIRQRWTFDLVWPLLYGRPLYLMMNKFLFALNWKKLSFIKYLPLLAILFDYLENIVFTILVLNYPVIFNFLPVIGVNFSLIKWILLFVSMLATLLISISFIYQYFKQLFYKKI
jgi:hypothetical protein